jgi:hypothetical protein
MVEAGQLRRWRANSTPYGEESPVFLVLEPYAIPVLGTGWNDPGWYILVEGRQHWVYESDIEDDSDVLGDR